MDFRTFRQFSDCFFGVCDQPVQLSLNWIKYRGSRNPNRKLLNYGVDDLPIVHFSGNVSNICLPLCVISLMLLAGRYWLTKISFIYSWQEIVFFAPGCVYVSTVQSGVNLRRRSFDEELLPPAALAPCTLSDITNTIVRNIAASVDNTAAKIWVPTTFEMLNCNQFFTYTWVYYALINDFCHLKRLLYRFIINYRAVQPTPYHKL